MPVLSRFSGIVVYMNYREHNPPHFHVRYQGYEVSIEIQSGIVEGRMPRRVLKLVIAWAEEHQDELTDNGQRAQLKQPLFPIPPLD